MSILPGGGNAPEEQKNVSPTSIFLIEDSELTRAVIRESLHQYDGLNLVGEAEDGELAIKQALELEPQVIIVDIGLPGMDGIEVLKRIKARLPETRMVVLTSQASDSSMFKAFSAGADAYLVKDDFTPEKLEEAIRDVNSGSQWLDPSIAKEVLSQTASQAAAHAASQAAAHAASQTSSRALSETASKSSSQTDAAPTQAPKLTAEEERVLNLVAEQKVPLKQQRRSKYRQYSKDTKDNPAAAEEVLGKIEAEAPSRREDWKDFMQRLNRFKGED
jgi:DNA-binding NarL/FixJ family response regulator